ncbi:unnamed protein product [Amoebophrya sp. A25]|nr:unnamed protein product [Amoebophrya sp. A25]|eukprot:GSA25T00011374001.1
MSKPVFVGFDGEDETAQFDGETHSPGTGVKPELDPQQWAAEVARTAAGDWWLDAVILGRLARLAERYSTMRTIHSPFTAWRGYLHLQKAKRKIDRERFFRVLMRSWRYRMLVRNPKITHMVRASLVLRRLIRSRLRMAWEPLSRPVLVGRVTRRSAAMAKLLHGAMKRHLSMTLYRGRLQGVVFKAWRNAPKDSLGRPRTSIKKRASETIGGSVSSRNIPKVGHTETETEKMLQSRPFILLTKQRAWARWQRGVRWHMSAAEWQVYQTEKYYHGESAILPPAQRAILNREVQPAKADSARSRRGDTARSSPAKLRGEGTDPTVTLGDYCTERRKTCLQNYDRVLQDDWVPFPGLDEPDEAVPDAKSGTTREQRPPGSRLPLKHKAQFSTQLWSIAHKIGSTALLSHDERADRWLDAGGDFEVDSGHEGKGGFEIAAKRPYSPRTLVIMRNVERLRKIDAPGDEPDLQGRISMRDALLEPAPEEEVDEVERSRSPVGKEPSADEEEAAAVESENRSSTALQVPDVPFFRPSARVNDEGQAKKGVADASAYKRLKRTVLQQGGPEPVKGVALRSRIGMRKSGAS